MAFYDLNLFFWEDTHNKVKIHMILTFDMAFQLYKTKK